MLSANAAPTTAPAAALIVRVAPANREELLSLRAAPPPVTCSRTKGTYRYQKSLTMHIPSFLSTLVYARHA